MCGETTCGGFAAAAERASRIAQRTLVRMNERRIKDASE
jgi:hypothetical protein